MFTRFSCLPFLYIFFTAILPIYSKDIVNEEPKNKNLSFGVFADTYYSHNLNYPKNRNRLYTTQAVRNDELNLNLGFVDVKWEGDRFRGRIALQAGTSVNSNYANEVGPNKNSVKHIQEAYIGYRLSRDTWVDAGIYLGHIGYESWISSENWNYTRALSSEYVPYYAAGIRFSHQISDRLNFQFHIMNGWQNISETNKDKSFGTQLKYNWNPKLIFTYNTFIGNEGLDRERKQTRYYQNLIITWEILKWISIATLADIGIQKNKQMFVYEPYWQLVNPSLRDYRETGSNSFSQWYQAGLWVKFQWTSFYRVSFRVERMYDPEQVIIQTNSRDGFMTSAYTTTLDYLGTSSAVFRFEYIQRDSFNKIFPIVENSKSRKEELVVLSMAVRF
ncbi:MAG: porin [Leptospira sp.]|jgi:hypothetical protein|nr:porin [Leptospira sp.]